MTFARLIHGIPLGDELMLRVGVNASGVKRGMAEATGHVETGASKWGAAFKLAGLGIASVAAGFAAFAVAGVKASADFEAALGKVYAMTGQSKDAIAGFHDEILKLSPIVGRAPDELAEALYFVASAGITGADALKVVEYSAKAATAGMTEVQTVADAVTSALNAYGLSADKAAYITDVMTQTVISGKSEWADVAGAIGKVSVWASTAGLSFEELNAALAEATQIGLSAQDASNQLVATIRSLLVPTERQWKTFAQLGITYDENTLKTKGLIGVLRMFEAQIGKATIVTIKNKDGTVNLNKTLEATDKINRGANDRWRKLLGSSQAFLVTQLLLKNGGAQFNRIMEDFNDVAGKTDETFQKMREMNMEVMWDALKARITVAQIALSEGLLPPLMNFIGAMSEMLPKAFEAIAAIWNSTLGPAFGHLGEALGKLFDSIGGVFDIFGDSKKKTDPMTDGLSTIATLLASIVDWGAKVVTVFAAILDNSFVKAVAQLALGFAAISVAMSGIRAGAGLITRMTSSTVRFMSGGLMGGPAPLNQAAQLGGAAKGLDAAALRLTEAATALIEAAGVMRLGGMGGGLPTMGIPVAGRTALGGASTSLLEREAAVAGRGLIATATSALGRGIGAAATTARTGLALGRGALGLIGGTIGRVFWPVMIGSMVLEIADQMLAEPIGTFVSEQLGKTNLGAEIVQKGVLSGLSTWLTASLNGVDVEQISNLQTDEFTVGDVTIDRVDAAKLGLGSATMQELFAEDATFSGQLARIKVARLVFSNEVIPEIEVPDFTLPAPAEIPDLELIDEAAVEAYVHNLMSVANDLLGSDEVIQQAIDASQDMDPAARAKFIHDALVRALTAQMQPAMDAWRTGVETALIDQFGITGYQANLIPTSTMERIAALLSDNANGQYNELIQQLVTASLQGLLTVTTPMPGGAGEAGHEIAAAQAEMIRQQAITALREAGASMVEAGGDWQTIFGPQAGEAAQAWLDTWSQKFADADTTEEQDAIGAQLGTTWEGAQAIFAQKLGLSQKATAAAAARDWFKAYGDEYKRISALPDTDRDAAAAALGFTDWQNMVDGFNEAMTASGQTDLIQMATDYANFLVQMNALGVDGAMDPAAIKIHSLLTNALSSGLLAPDVAKQIQDILTNALDKPQPEVDKKFKDHGLGGFQEFADGYAEDTKTDTSFSSATISWVDKNSGAINTRFRTAGETAWHQFLSGIDTASGDTTTIDKALGGIKKKLPQSPVQEGPLKHPFLHNAGRMIIKQISGGMESAQFGMPELKMRSALGAGLVQQPAGAGGVNQRIDVDRMYLANASDERTMLERLRFLSPEELMMAWFEQWTIKVDGTDINDGTTFFCAIPEIENSFDEDLIFVQRQGDYPLFVRSQPKEGSMNVNIVMRPCTWDVYSTRLATLKTLFSRGIEHTLTVQVRGMANSKSLRFAVRSMAIDAKSRRVSVEVQAARPILE